MKTFLILFLAFFGTLPASRADSLCDFYRKSQPALYKLICAGGSTSSKPAGASSTFNAAFNLSSASLPTEPSSYGLETLLHRIRGGDGKVSPTFSIVKGFQKFGTGISTSSNVSFYGDDLPHRIVGPTLLRDFNPTEAEKGSLPNLNIGTSFALAEFQKGPTVRIGLSGRYNKTTDSWGGGPALLLNWSRLSLGSGFSRERVSNLLPQILFTTTSASVRVSILEFEYIVLTDNVDLPLGPVQILTMTATVRRLLLTAAVRKLDYLQTGEETQWHFAAQYLFTDHLSAGFLYNYIPGANSVGIQYFL